MTGQTTPTPIRTDLPMAFPRNLVSTILVASLLMITMSKQGEAWVPPHTVISRGPLSTTGMSHRLTVSSTTLTSLMATADQQEKELRQKLSNRNTVTNGEERYAVADGAFLEKLNRPEATKSGSKEQINQVVDESSTSKLAVTVQRMIKPRAYPLFLTEKALEVVEAATSGLFRSADPLDDHDSTLRGGTKRERVVVLGTGWGAMSFLKEIDTSMYDVTVVSPRNHFVFTPMLAGASVGTVEFRSICEPIREINRQAQYLEAQATRIDPRTKTVECQSVVCDGNSCDIDDFTISYDRLVVTVGAQTNTFGIPGVRENCCFLKDVNDARRIRTAIVNCFERASLPHLTDEQRTRDLTFVVIGAGPTGVETSSEIRDFLQEDVPKYYPNLLKYVRIKVIEASSTVLAPFDKSLQEEAIRQLNREFRTRDRMAANLVPPGFRPCELMLQSSVKEIGEDRIILNDGTQIPYGVAIWAAGNGPIPLTLQLIDALGAEQQNEQSVARGRLAIDPWMRVIGSEGQILAFGDCSCITSGQLPATAQVAAQQGEYIAGVMNKRYDLSPMRSEDQIFPPPAKIPGVTRAASSDFIAGFAMNSYEYAKPFQFLNLGILAYTGQNTALAQVTPVPNARPVKGKGNLGNAVWRSVYLSKQVSWRNRFLVLNDWTNRRIFGRDITRI